MDDTTSKAVVAELYNATAYDIEHRWHSVFLGGPDVWRSMHQVGYDLFDNPAMEGLRRHLKLDQVQQWRADQPTVVATLRGLAGQAEDLGTLREADAEQRIADATKLLREALGQPGDDGTLGQIADSAAFHIRRLIAENARLVAAQRPAA
jgi:hypothetical protein